MKLKIKEKSTRRTWNYFPEINLCMMIGHKIFIECGRAGYSERNEDGEDVLDSWIEQPFYVILKE